MPGHGSRASRNGKASKPTEIIESLFDFYFVQAARNKEKI